MLAPRSVLQRKDGQYSRAKGLETFALAIPDLVECISSVMPLLPGDIISTGTPVGVGR
jgi:2-keto-4-pentenoate hydratase/2-oxohepta-3-ene-1,7-dioic acid hydratase in catechol pathway